MTDASDRRLGMDRKISRRDFLDGLAIATGMALTPFGCNAGVEDTYAPEQAPGYYPPALTGLRGSHPGSYEVAHQLRDGTLGSSIGRPRDTGERYDLVVVGAGISGLSAAYFYRKARPDAGSSCWTTTMTWEAMRSVTSSPSASGSLSPTAELSPSRVRLSTARWLEGC